MGDEDLEVILETTAEPFNRRIADIGEQMEQVLPPEHRPLVDALDTAHFERTGALIEKARQVAYGVGRVVGGYLGPAVMSAGAQVPVEGHGGPEPA